VLGEAGGPLNTKEMVERMLERGLWKTGGRTPASTIYAAILRECQQKGDKSRFRKVERGASSRWSSNVVARLGGFLARKSDGTPGWLTLWRGWQKLTLLVQGFALAGGQKCG